MTLQVERIKATEPDVVAPIGTGALEEHVQASRKALEVSTRKCTHSSQTQTGKQEARSSQKTVVSINDGLTV